jgi:ATP-dependent Lhr-like helicase
VELDKREQTGDWTRRPLTESQVTYAALDAEVLLRLFARFAEASNAYVAQEN